MNEKQLAKWLMDLAACYDHVPQKAAIARYLRILTRWKLSPLQWERLGDLAVLRITRRFPMPGELQEIATELRDEEELRANTEHLAHMREEWRQQAEASADCHPGCES
jgi:hypothetical protein